MIPNRYKADMATTSDLSTNRPSCIRKLDFSKLSFSEKSVSSTEALKDVVPLDLEGLSSLCASCRDKQET